MAGRLDGRTAVVTGASRGLGRAIAERFAVEGAAVAVVDLKQAWADGVAQAIAEAGGSAIGLAADVSDRDAVRVAFVEVRRAFGSLDVVVNNAMWNRYEPIDAITPQTLDRMLGVGFRAIVWATQAAAELMPPGGGAIVNIGSVSGALGIPNALAYCGIKAGVEGLTRAAAVELGPRGVRVNAVAPSTVATEGVMAMLDQAALADRRARVPLGRLGEAGDIADAALWLASDEARFVTGQILAVDGGMSRAYL